MTLLRDTTTRGSSIKMTPVEASKKENEVRVYRNLYQKFEKTADTYKIQNW